MAIDLTGGMEPSKDFFLADRPEDPQFRESASFWVSDHEGRIGLPRIGIEAVSEAWDSRGLQVNLGFPDGRTVIVLGSGEGRSPLDDDGTCRTFAAGGLVFRLRRAVPDPDLDLPGQRVGHERRGVGQR